MPIFQAEMVPPASRGFIVATYQISLMVRSHARNLGDCSLTQMQTGGLVVNCIARGTSSLSSNAAWQIPLGLFYLVPSVVAALIWLIPEVSLPMSSYITTKCSTSHTHVASLLGGLS